MTWAFDRWPAGKMQALTNGEVMEVVAVPAGGRPRVLAALYGPTSSGKTALSVALAVRIRRELGREVVIISADSRQVYRYLDIGTSKTTPEEMGGIRHEMLDVATPDRKFELEDYARQARQHIADAFTAGAVPFVVGGTGVYVNALLSGWDVDRVGTVRASLRRDFPRSMAPDAYAMLGRLDRAAASRVHPNNYEAIINSLASVMSDRDATRHRPDGRPDAKPVVLGLDPGPAAVDKRVARTYDNQVRRGLLDEIAGLEARYDLGRQLRLHGRDSANQVLHTHGYREYFDLAAQRGKPVTSLTDADLAEVRDEVIEHIRAYTRRQRSWFGKLPKGRPW